MTNVLLVDGTNMVMRSAFVMAAAGPLAAVSSEEAGRRALSSIRFAARDWTAHYTIIALDVPGESWRKQLFPAYKANRAEDHKTERFSLALCEAAEAERFMCVGLPGWEADDVLATYAHKITTPSADDARANRFYRVRILSYDTDLLQCVTEKSVSVVHRSDPPTEFGEGAVFVKYGVYPPKLPTWKALVGERGDNLPGVPQIGPKRASALLERYGSLEHIIHAGRDGSIRDAARVTNVEDQARLVEKLATLRTDAPVPTLGSKARTPSTATTSERLL